MDAKITRLIEFLQQYHTITYDAENISAIDGNPHTNASAEQFAKDTYGWFYDDLEEGSI